MAHGKIKLPGRRAGTAGALALAGAAALGFAFLQPSGGAAIPGWEPVNAQVAKALDELASPSPHAPPATSSAPQAEASAVPSAPASAAAPAAPAADGMPSAASPPAASGLLNLNAATAEQLDALKGIGPSKARAIVEYRTANGPYRQVDDLLNVKGIGPKLLEAVRGQLTV